MRLQNIEIPVADLARAARFYADVLELPPVVRMGDHAASFFLGDAHGGMITLVRSTRPPEGGGPVVVFQAEGGIEEARARLERLAVRFTGATEHSPLGLTAYFLDSEGNRLAIFDGSLSARFREQARAPLSDLEAKLSEVEARTMAVFEGLSEVQARHIPAPGEWPIVDHIGHIVDSLDSCGQISRDLSSGRQPPRDRLWQKEYPSLSFAHALEELRRGFADAHAWLANVPAANGNDAVLPHGVFGPLNHREWVAFMFFHLGMHADQVKGIRSGVGFPAT